MEVTAYATRSGGWWALEVPSVPGLFTQVRRLDQVSGTVIDAAAMFGVDVEHVEVVPVLSDDDRQLLEYATRTRETARAAEAEASAASREVVARFRKEGLTVRDVAVLLDISPQRASVLAR